MDDAHYQQPTIILNGYPLSTLALSLDLEADLSSMGVTTLERLALLALTPSDSQERALQERLRAEFQARFPSHKIVCRTNQGYAAHFILAVEGLFFFKASVIPDDDTSWSCSYQWKLPLDPHHLNTQENLFHMPSQPEPSEVADHRFERPRDKVSEADLFEQVIEAAMEHDQGGAELIAQKLEERAVQPTEVTPDPAQSMIESMLGLLRENEREVLKLRYGLQNGHGLTLDQIGQHFGFSRARALQIEQRALGKLPGVCQPHLNSRLEQLAVRLQQNQGVLGVEDALTILEGSLPPGIHQATIAAHLGFLLRFTSDIQLYKERSIVALKGVTLPAPNSAKFRAAAEQTVIYTSRPASDRTPATQQPQSQQADSSAPTRPWDSYDIWNHAIATYVTAGAQRGSIVYLSIDDEILEQIQQQMEHTSNQTIDSFAKSLHQRVVGFQHIKLQTIRGHNTYGEPNCIAFLAGMVLAAARMAEDEDEAIADTNYFTRLCQVLNLPESEGRPQGLAVGSEEPLWREWIIWLSKQGLISSAQPGGGKRDKYINYPISQALLRGADRDRLRRLFVEQSWRAGWDADTLLSAVRRESQRLSKHLRMLLEDQSQRIAAVAEAIHEVYEQWLSGDTDQRRTGQVRGRVLFAELLRRENILSGEIDYFIYPRSPRRQQISTIELQINSQHYSTATDQPGWYQPVCPVTLAQLNNGARFPITNPSFLEALVLPQRNFWIISPDPDNPESDVYASWGSVPLGTRFILFCQQDILPEIEILRAEQLLQWSGQPCEVAGLTHWIEIHDCMVISSLWESVSLERIDLLEALRPRETLYIGLSGGLRSPSGGWIAEYGPDITAFGFQAAADLIITRITDDFVVYEDSQPTNQPIKYIWRNPGDYLITATCGTSKSQRLVKIVRWDDLSCESGSRIEWLTMNSWRISGALIEDLTGED